jgi:hypothetical protein
VEFDAPNSLKGSMFFPEHNSIKGFKATEVGESDVAQDAFGCSIPCNNLGCNN